MKLSEHVLHAIDDAAAGKFEPALLHACISVDATAKRLLPLEAGVRKRFVECIRTYYWIVEPMLGSGINLVETKFSNVKLKSNPNPDLAEIVYEIFRCSHAHGDEVPASFAVIPTKDGDNTRWQFSEGSLHMPDRIVWALLAVSVFSRVNRDQQTTSEHWLSLGKETFVIRSWWGWEDHFRQIADRYNQVRVKFEGLGGSWAGSDS